MRILVTGGTGFIGKALCQRLLDESHEVIVVTRDIKKPHFSKNVMTWDALDSLEEIDVIINLAGQSLFSGRWNKRRKQEFIDSRVGTTKALVEYIKNIGENGYTKPKLLISGSAIGFYGHYDDEELTEDSSPRDCFTHELCKKWETEALKAEKYGVRTCLLRTGIVFGKGGGALSQMLPPFKLGLGGRMGSGKQYMSWIHIDDLIGIILHLIKNEDITGAVNGTSPNPITNSGFTTTLAKTLNRPTLLPMPAFAMRFLLGEVADEILLIGQKVLPQKVLSSGYKFAYPELGNALRNIIEN